MKRCLMITGGRLSFPFACEFLKDRSYDLVIAVDAGLSCAEKLGIRPDVAVGDFDTLGRERLLAYQAGKKLDMDIHQPEKDETDTDLAFSTAADRGCTEIDVLGATGGRLDHELSNIHLLARGLRWGLCASIYDEQNRVYLLDAGKQKRYEFRKPELYGKYVSFLPLTEQVRGITLTGFKYPLHLKDISVFENPSLCVSNEVVAQEAVMSFEEGVLICVESHD